ncbi:hypothetical protein [Ferrovibrio sp.]|uniref:hypothetical protein n=1 Tax=Ferrovibrio sp. TaxID=1917215 RepID=UPI000CAB9A87|nr:hypothetical protein [Ferrovibrio sp.]PJI40142.1 MAG: hypothetical protein CTR53_10690 [Ferrovibrio sp.]
MSATDRIPARYSIARDLARTALGLLTRDGLGALAGHFVGIASMALFVILGIGLIRAGTDFTDWLLW